MDVVGWGIKWPADLEYLLCPRIVGMCPASQAEAVQEVCIVIRSFALILVEELFCLAHMVM